MLKDPFKFTQAHRPQSVCSLSLVSPTAASILLDPALHWLLSPSVSYITSRIRVRLSFTMNMEAVCFSGNACIRLHGAESF